MNLKRTLLTSFLINLILVLILVLAGLLLVYFNRGLVFEYFASEYFKDVDRLLEDELRDSVFIEDHESRIIDIVNSADPAVVSIALNIETDESDRVLFFEEFGFDMPSVFEDDTRESGSGFIVSPDGFIVTNRHVVIDEDQEYTILTDDGENFSAEVLARDHIFDIAILKIESESDLPYLKFSVSEDVQVGQTAIAIGNALGEFRNTVSVGVVSGLSRSIFARDMRGSGEFLDEVIQTDAALNPGNSGGPLLDINGEVIGVNTALAFGSQNIGFSIPAHLVSPIVRSVIEEGRIIRAFLGIRYASIDRMVQAREDLSVDYGVLVVTGPSGEPAITPDSPAEEIGLESGDIILEIDGERLEESYSLAHIIRRKDVGEEITLKVLRGEEEFILNTTLIEAPGDL